MKTKQQLIIDNYIAKPIAYLLNFVVRLVGKILSIDHSLERNFKRIVICKFKGMGSIIQATPMIGSIRKKHPNAEIIFVSTSANLQILQKIKTIDTIITINDKGLFSLIKTLGVSLIKLIRMRPDVYIDLEIYSNFSTLVTLFSLAKNRIGFYLRSSSFRMGIYTHMMFFNSKAPIAEVYLQIARLFGKIEEHTELYPLHQEVNTDIHSLIPKNKYIVINPNASDLRIERRWGKNNFKKLIQLIHQKYSDLNIILIGSNGEKDYSQSVINDLAPSERIINLAGKTSIDELIIIIKNAALIITNDTGPMHIAFACKAPSICLFGPCSPEQYGWFKDAKIIYKKVYCSPCVHDFSVPPCHGNNTCMQLIEVIEVMKVVSDYFDRGIPLQTKTNKTTTHYFVDDDVLGLVNRKEFQ